MLECNYFLNIFADSGYPLQSTDWSMYFKYLNGYVLFYGSKNCTNIFAFKYFLLTYWIYLVLFFNSLVDM